MMYTSIHLKEARFQIVHVIELFIYYFDKINIININKDKNNNINK